MRIVFAAFGLLVALAILPVESAQSGDLKGKFVIGGALPAPKRLDANKDPQVCAKTPLFDESVVVGEDNALANVVIWIYPGTGVDPPKPHFLLAKELKKTVAIDNVLCRFEPHIAVVHTGQTLEIRNSDPVQHNTKIDFFTNNPINPLIPANGKLQFTFEQPERLPSPASCAIHPWMNAYIFVTNTPYVAVSNAQGEFEIPKLPAGTWNFRVWQEKAGYIRSVTVNGKKEEWSKGVFSAKVGALGATDLGTIVIDPELFK